MPDHDYQVRVYTRPGCMPCQRTKTLLDQASVPYTEIDVATDPAAAERVRALGHSSAPVVTVELPDGLDHWSGYDRAKIDALCYLAGKAGGPT